MRIKHWAGYGFVNARKQKEYPYEDGKIVEVYVSGNHEQGLDRPFYDVYCFQNWLGRFSKGWTLRDYRVASHGYTKVEGLDTETMVVDLYFVKE